MSIFLSINNTHQCGIFSILLNENPTYYSDYQLYEIKSFIKNKLSGISSKVKISSPKPNILSKFKSYGVLDNLKKAGRGIKNNARYTLAFAGGTLGLAGTSLKLAGKSSKFASKLIHHGIEKPSITLSDLFAKLGIKGEQILKKIESKNPRDIKLKDKILKKLAQIMKYTGIGGETTFGTVGILSAISKTALTTAGTGAEKTGDTLQKAADITLQKALKRIL